MGPGSPVTDGLQVSPGDQMDEIELVRAVMGVLGDGGVQRRHWT